MSLRRWFDRNVLCVLRVWDPSARARLERALGSLVAALELGGYAAAPTELTQGSALVVEDLSPTMTCVTFNEEALVPFAWTNRAWELERWARLAHVFYLRGAERSLRAGAEALRERARLYHEGMERRNTEAQVTI